MLRRRSCATAFRLRGRATIDTDVAAGAALMRVSRPPINTVRKKRENGSTP